jgi:uracil-DNA glycosylase
MLVGEQPGDRKTVKAARSSDGRAALGQSAPEAGVDRKRVYVTNAVKHFKFEPRGKRRLHKRPSASEIRICRRWLSRRSKR